MASASSDPPSLPGEALKRGALTAAVCELLPCARAPFARFRLLPGLTSHPHEQGVNTRSPLDR